MVKGDPIVALFYFVSLIPKGDIRGLLVIKMTFGQKEVSGLLITIISLPLLKHVVISIL